MPTTVLLQPLGVLHRFARPNHAFAPDSIVERPERLRAVHLGVAGAVARLEHVHHLQQQHQRVATGPKTEGGDAGDALADALQGLALGAAVAAGAAVPEVRVSAPAAPNLIRSKAVALVHDAPPDDDDEQGGERYLEGLLRWIREAEGKWQAGESEIPSELPQLDLYLCKQSLVAIEGALSTTMEAVDLVVASSSSSAPSSSLSSSSTDTPAPAQGDAEAHTAFCAIRPPGHHCEAQRPMGFCFVNNVAVAAAHAHLKHGIDRVVILDIDLHHGNGTQEIALRLNAASHREDLLLAGGMPAPRDGRRGLKVFYGSVHDIYSYPCEDGDLDRIKEASLNLAAHGQYIENIPLQPYTTPSDFHTRLYPLYAQLLSRAAAFLTATSATPEKTLVLVSCGFDASEHEGGGMSRHGARVPAGFFARFHSDAVAFARAWARGKCVSVLEGGYGNRALASGAMAAVVGLSGAEVGEKERERWWAKENLVKMEKLFKRPPPRTKSTRATANPETAAADADGWLQRTAELFAAYDAHSPAAASKGGAGGGKGTPIPARERRATRAHRKADPGRRDETALPPAVVAGAPAGAAAGGAVKIERVDLAQGPLAAQEGAPAHLPPSSAPVAAPPLPPQAAAPLLSSDRRASGPPQATPVPEPALPAEPEKRKIILKFRNPNAPPLPPAAGLEGGEEGGRGEKDAEGQGRP